MRKLEKINLASFHDFEIESHCLSRIIGGLADTFSYCETSTCTSLDYRDSRTDFYDDNGKFKRSNLAIYEDCC